MKQIKLNLSIPSNFAGQRCDQAIAKLLPDYSRSRIQQWFQQNMILINGIVCKPRTKVLGNEQVVIDAHLPASTAEWQAEAIALTIIYEDHDILVINKPAGLVVHPGAGNYDGTLLNALLHHLPTLASLPRAGIVHRLDKDTSGLLVIAKTLEAHTQLVKQLQARTVKRQYIAIVIGKLPLAGTVDAPIGRHTIDRKRMAVVSRGKVAITHYKVMQTFTDFSLVEVSLETGRTHQIRVHMAFIKHPLVADPIYAKKVKLPKNMSAQVEEAIKKLNRQALHAKRLGLIHPATQKYMEWTIALPNDMQELLEKLAIE